MKRLIISLFAALALIVPARSQMQSGMWEVFPSFGTPTKLLDTPDYVYLLTNMSLIGIDKQTDELIAFNTSHRLNSNQVSGIWYCREGKFLFVIHTNGMIDLLYDDGRTVNIADLTNTTVDLGTFNDVDFRDGKAYVALSKGLLVVDTNRGFIDQVGLFDNNFARVAATDSKVVLVHADNGRLFTADRKGDLSTYASFNANNVWVYRPNSTTFGDIYGLTGDKLVAVGTDQSNRYPSVITVNPQNANNACLSTPVRLSTEACQNSRLNPAKNGFAVTTNKSITYISDAGEIIKAVPHGIASINNTTTALSNWDSDQSDSPWFVDANGIGRRNNDGTFAQAQVCPSAISGTSVGQFAPTPDGRLYLSTVGIGLDLSLSYNKNAFFNRIEDNKLSPVPFAVKSIYAIAANPLNPDEIVIAGFSGLYRYNTATNESVTYTTANSGLRLEGAYQITDVVFDNAGNLFVLQKLDSSGAAGISAVSAADWNNGAPKSSWQSLILQDLDPRHSSRLAVHPSGYLIVSGDHMIGLVKLKAPNSDLTGATVYIDKWSVDADGMTLSGYESPSIYVDSKLRTWIGNDLGVILYPDIAKAFTGNALPERPKVAREDGTNLADFLLDNIWINSITSDANGNLWIATKGSGLYRVNEDGTQILDVYTQENSGLPSDNVLAVHADPNSNKVYVGTDLGMAIYHSLSYPSKRDFSDVYAFPNPVTPDYTGHITIAGLMSNSLVKITDSAGRIVHEAKSDGGSVVWNGCDSTGNRVKSGVYFVYASQNSNGSSSAAVTKIVVVN